MGPLLRFAAAAVTATAISLGCSSSDDSANGSKHPTTAEIALAEEAAEAAMTAQQALVVGDELFRFDPDLDPNGTAAQNLDTIKNNLTTDGQSCVTITPLLGGLKADFGAGCTLGTTGITLAGVITVQVEKAEGSPIVNVTLGFENFTINGYDIVGSASFATGNGSSFNVKLDLTHAGKQLTADLDVSGTLNSITFGGTATYGDVGSQNPLAITLTDVVFVPGSCYPSGGSLESGGQKLSFDQNTATSGQATLTIGSWSGCTTLPPYGNCVPTPCPPKGG